MKTGSLRILYVGLLRSGSTALQRLEAIRSLDTQIEAFDTTPWMGYGSRIERSLAHRLGWGRGFLKLNAKLLNFARDKSIDWVWIDKGVWITPRTLRGLRERTGALLVHYTPDPAILFHKTRHFMRSIPVYDVLITSKRFELEAYHRHGARKVLLLPQGFDRDLFRPYEVTRQEREAYESDVCFIGHFEDHYCACAQAASEVTDRLAVWGPWQAHARRQPWLQRSLRGDGIWHEAYAKALCCAKIGLGLLSKFIPETSTTRTFEIPACGTFMLAERTDEHLEYFDEGVEAEFFESRDELREKARFYLKNDRLRGQIAARGRERCLRSGYTYHDRMRQSLSLIEAQCESRGSRAHD